MPNLSVLSVAAENEVVINSEGKTSKLTMLLILSKEELQINVHVYSRPLNFLSGIICTMKGQMISKPNDNSVSVSLKSMKCKISHYSSLAFPIALKYLVYVEMLYKL